MDNGTFFWQPLYTELSVILQRAEADSGCVIDIETSDSAAGEAKHFFLEIYVVKDT